jgi:hypothetical protein
MSYMKPLKPVFRLFSSTGTGAGTTSAVGDYSVTPLSLQIKSRATDYLVINRIIISVEDAGNFDAGGYGNGSALTNGIRIYLKDGDGEIAELTSFPITTNSHWAAHCHDLTIHSFGTGNTLMSVRWTIGASGRPLVLNGPDGHYLEVVFNDDHTNLIAQRVIGQGYLQDVDY